MGRYASFLSSWPPRQMGGGRRCRRDPRPWLRTGPQVWVVACGWDASGDEFRPTLVDDCILTHIELEQLLVPPSRMGEALGRRHAGGSARRATWAMTMTRWLGASTRVARHAWALSRRWVQ